MEITYSSSGWNFKLLLKQQARKILGFAKDFNDYTVRKKALVPILIIAELLKKIPNGFYPDQLIDEIKEDINSEFYEELK